MGLFGPEKMIVALEQYNFFPGETIKGTLSINLKKPKKARKLEIALVGEKKERRRSSDGKTHTKTVRLYNFRIPLGQEGEYQKGDYPFEIKIPQNLLESTANQRPDGAAGAVVDVLSAVSGNRTGPVQWYIEGQLDIPMGFDVKKKQSIAIA
mgnify:FL=1